MTAPLNLYEATAAMNAAREYMAVEAQGDGEIRACLEIIKDCEERIVELILLRGERSDA